MMKSSVGGWVRKKSNNEGRTKQRKPTFVTDRRGGACVDKKEGAGPEEKSEETRIHEQGMEWE